MAHVSQSCFLHPHQLSVCLCYISCTATATYMHTPKLCAHSLHSLVCPMHIEHTVATSQMRCTKFFLFCSTCFLRQYRLYLSCRYVGLFSLRGIAEWALASGKLIAEGKGPTKDAAQQEALMYQQLGILKGMDKPVRWTSGLNWYRYVVINATKSGRCNSSSQLCGGIETCFMLTGFIYSPC